MPINASILKSYTACHRIFIETGTHMGDGVQAALDAGFSEIHTCDLDMSKSMERFNNDQRVGMAGGDSRDCLDLFLGLIEEPVLFWLDAHATDGGGGSYADCPLLGELAEIVKSPIKTHTILIDDMRLIGSNALRLDPSTDNFCMWKLQDAIKAINPAYKLRLIDSALFAWDILECTV